MRKRTDLRFISVLVFVLALVSGCTATYNPSQAQSPSAKLDRSLGVLISTPKNGWYNNSEYQNSGKMTTNAARSAFSEFAARVDIVDSCHGENCLDTIDTGKYGYYVKPEILHWEDRATEWSGKSDRLEIQLLVYDSVSKEVLANLSFTGKSKWATFGGDHPQDLLPEPMNQSVSSLYQ